MVVQWEDRFYKANRAHTYLGRRVRRAVVMEQGAGVPWAVAAVLGPSCFEKWGVTRLPTASLPSLCVLMPALGSHLWVAGG